MTMAMPHDSMNNCSALCAAYDVFILQLLTDPHVVRCFQPITDSWKDPENLNATLSSSKWGKHKYPLVLTMTIWMLVCIFQSGETQTMRISIPFQHTQFSIKKTLFIRKYATLSDSNNQDGKKEKFKVWDKVTNSRFWGGGSWRSFADSTVVQSWFHFRILGISQPVWIYHIIHENRNTFLFVRY